MLSNHIKIEDIFITDEISIQIYYTLRKIHSVVKFHHVNLSKNIVNFHFS